MNSTKHELSFMKVTLDVDALLMTANIATGAVRAEIERELREIQGAHLYHLDKNPYAIVAHAAERLSDAARRFQIAAETAEALAGLKTREECVLVRGERTAFDEVALRRAA
jgi:hypothetical protein